MNRKIVDIGGVIMVFILVMVIVISTFIIRSETSKRRKEIVDLIEEKDYLIAQIVSLKEEYEEISSGAICCPGCPRLNEE